MPGLVSRFAHVVISVLSLRFNNISLLVVSVTWLQDGVFEFPKDKFLYSSDTLYMVKHMTCNKWLILYDYLCILTGHEA